MIKQFFKGQFKAVCLSLLFIFGNTLQVEAASAWQPQQPFTSSIGPDDPSGATDGVGNALGIYLLPGGILTTSYFDSVSESWQAPQSVVATPFISLYALDMDATGDGIALWSEQLSNNIRSARYSGGAAGTWTILPPDPINVLANPNAEVDVAMDGSGNAAGIWIDTTALTVTTAFFDGTTWGAPTLIGAGESSPTIKYSSSGTAVAIWDNVGVVTASHSIAGVFQAPVILGNRGPSRIDLGVDNAGNAIAIWMDSGVIFTSNFNGTTWGAAVAQSTGTGNIDPIVAMAANGTAVIGWVDGAGNAQSRAYNGTIYGPTLLIAADSASVAISVDALGNALAIFGPSTAVSLPIFSLQLPVGGTAWENLLVVGEAAMDNDTVSVLSSGGEGFAFIFPVTPDGRSFAGVALLIVPEPTPPLGISGSVCVNKFASQTDRIHIINFQPSTDPTVVSYILRRNGVIIATIPSAGPYTYLDHNRCKRTDVYSLTSVNAEGLESTPLVIELR